MAFLQTSRKTNKEALQKQFRKNKYTIVLILIVVASLLLGSMLGSAITLSYVNDELDKVLDSVKEESSMFGERRCDGYDLQNSYETVGHC